MKKLFWLDACRVETTKTIIDTDITIELNLFVFKSFFKINNCHTSIAFNATMNKKLSFKRHLYFGRNIEVIKTANKISIMTLIIKEHGNCKINWFLKFHKSRTEILIIMNFIKKNLTLRLAYKSKIIWNIQKQKWILRHKVLQIQNSVLKPQYNCNA